MGLRMPNRASHTSARPGLADRLLHATTPAQVADVLIDGDVALAISGASLLWSSRWPQDIEAYPSPYVQPDALTAAIAAVQAARDGAPTSGHTQVLCDQDSGVAVLHAPQPIEEIGRASCRERVLASV